MITWIIFIFKQKMAYGMGISDGSSDVCSSDLSQVSQEGRQQIDLCSGQHARQLAMTCLKAAQDNLAAWLEQAANQHALGDHFCLEGLDYAGAFQRCSQLFAR